jgi:chemotaxis protein MotB
VETGEQAAAALRNDLQAARADAQAARAAESALSAERDRLTAEVAKVQGALSQAKQESETLRADLAGAADAAGAQIAALEQRVAAAAADLEASGKESLGLRQQLDDSLAQLSSLKADLDTANARGASSETELEQQRTELARIQGEADRLTRQREAFQAETLRLLGVLRAADGRIQEQARTLAASNANVDHLAARLTELNRFRSEFLARLGAVLGDRENVRIVGDRFVFQAEVLFDSGSAELGAAGRAQLTKVAASLNQIAPQIPSDMEWFVRVDGHTDNVPIQSGRFTSNWDLSLARALAVVRYLISQGVPPERLSANGFGEYQPLDVSDTPEAHRRNRRIELELGQR